LIFYHPTSIDNFVQFLYIVVHKQVSEIGDPIVKSNHVCFLSIIILAIILIASGCGDKSVNSDSPGSNFEGLLDNVTCVPSSGPPGTIVTLEGLSSLPADSGFTLHIGNQPVPLIVTEGMPIQTCIPIYVDTTVSYWPITPTGPQTVTIYYNGLSVDNIPNAIQMDSLIPACSPINSLKYGHELW